MKKAKKVTRTVSPKDAELRRWCIEMAMRWPTTRIGSLAGHFVGAAHIPPQPEREVDADVIGRADRLLSWLRK